MFASPLVTVRYVLTPLSGVWQFRPVYSPGYLAKSSLLDMHHLVMGHGGVHRAVETFQSIYLIRVEAGVVWLSLRMNCCMYLVPVGNLF